MKTNTSSSAINDSLLDSKIDLITEGLDPQYANRLRGLSSTDDIRIIVNFILSMKTESNLSDSHKISYINCLCQLSKFHGKKTLRKMSRHDVLQFLDSFRKAEDVDPLHKWIGTYNLYRALLLYFFKWLYYPGLERDKRPRPPIMENIPQLKRKEQSIYKPSDIWTVEDDALFLKYCPNKRDRCYHSISRDSSCRPSEILKLRIKDMVFKVTNDGKQYVEVLVSGKTGSRHIPLINSLVYIKHWLGEHPQQGNPDAPIICGSGRSLGRRLKSRSLNKIYDGYKYGLFSKLSVDPNVASEDRQKIKELLNKPWTPYIRRHSALTEKSTILKEHVLRQHAGWSYGSRMPQKYIHYFGNESSESLLEAYGIDTRNKRLSDALKPKQCPHCNEPNKPDSTFCAKCGMVLTYEAFSETLQNEKQKEDKISLMEEQFNTMQSQMQSLIATLGNMDESSKNTFAKHLFQSGIYQKLNKE